jgi:hypothetical protein
MFRVFELSPQGDGSDTRFITYITGGWRPEIAWYETFKRKNQIGYGTEGAREVMFIV